jgi:hypothetical protein
LGELLGHFCEHLNALFRRSFFSGLAIENCVGAQLNGSDETHVVVAVNLLKGAVFVAEVATGAIGAELLLVELSAVL